MRLNKSVSLLLADQRFVWYSEIDWYDQLFMKLEGKYTYKEKTGLYSTSAWDLTNQPHLNDCLVPRGLLRCWLHKHKLHTIFTVAHSRNAPGRRAAERGYANWSVLNPVLLR